jgi:hypothetical protein
VLEELREKSRGEKSIRYSGVCVCLDVRGRKGVCVSVLEKLKEESREEKSIR